MEGDLDKVEHGSEDWVEVLQEFYGPFAAVLTQAEQKLPKLEIRDEPTDEICPNCGRPMVIKTGRFGKFISCSGYPECKTTKAIVKDTGVKCPEDGGAIIERKSKKTGNIFFGCDKYPECKFVSWDRPVPEPCPSAGRTSRSRRARVNRSSRAMPTRSTTSRPSRARAPRMTLRPTSPATPRRPGSARRSRYSAIVQRLTIVGGGLAGCEAAWQAACAGVDVDLTRCGRARAARHTKRAGWPNSCAAIHFAGPPWKMRSAYSKKNWRDWIRSSSAAREKPPFLPEARSRSTASALHRRSSPGCWRIRASHCIAEEVTHIPLDRPCVVACGPLPSTALLASIDAVLAAAGGARLHYFDAASPIVAAESLDESQMYRKSRYDKATGTTTSTSPSTATLPGTDRSLRDLERHQPKDFEAGATPYFEGCLPIEEMADRGEDTLRYGPLKPVGLRDPRSGRTPYAVVQLRKENVAGTAYNLVGFQTRLSGRAARGVREIARPGRRGMASPGRDASQYVRRLAPGAGPVTAPSRNAVAVFAGQITGSEGYVEAAACGAMAGIHAARAILGQSPVCFPAETAFGAIVAHLQNRQTHDFQPANVTWAPFPPRCRGWGTNRKARAARADGRTRAAFARRVAGLAGPRGLAR